MTATRQAPDLGRTPTDTPRPPDPRLGRAALVGGVGLLVLAALAGAANVGVIQRLITTPEATRTANDIVPSEGLFRLGIVALVVVVVLDVVVAWALRTFFEPVHQSLATLAAWMRLSYAAIFAVAISNLVVVLELTTATPSSTTATIVQRHTEALLRIQAFQDVWHLGLGLFGIHLVLIGYLAYRSGYVPRILGVLLVIAGGGYLVDTFGGLLIARYSVDVSAVTFIGEALLMLWLLLKGRSVTLPE
jgi:hypothetical protein